MRALVVINLIGVLAFAALIAALLFGSAGRWDVPMFWAYVVVWAAAGVAGCIACDPTLPGERLRPGPGGKFYWTDFLIPPLWLAQYVVAGLGAGRLDKGDGVPLVMQVAGLMAMAAAMAWGVWAVAVNRFFSTAVRIQADRGHHVITAGPYRFVRHPGYAGTPFLFVGGGLGLGSWLAAVIGLIMALSVLVRTAAEDRILRAHLEGYPAYAQKVRYRLLPGVW